MLARIEDPCKITFKILLTIPKPYVLLEQQLLEQAQLLCYPQTLLVIILKVLL